MKFQFSKKFRTVYDFTQNFFFLTGLFCYAFLITVCILNQLQLQCSPYYQNIKGLNLNAYCISLPDFSCFKIFTFQCFKWVASFVFQEWYPPTTAVHLQTQSLDSSSASPTVASCTGGDKRRTKGCIFAARDWLPDLNLMPPISPKY